MNDPSLLEPIFSGKVGSLEPISIGQLTPRQREKLAKKKQQDEKKNVVMKKALGMFSFSIRLVR